MSAPVKQVLGDHDAWDGEAPVADPTLVTIEDDWRWVGFEFAGGRW